MVTLLDLAGLAFCGLTWLSPLCWNAWRGRLLLLHPIGFFPLMMVYMVIPPLVSKFQGESLLLTAQRFDPEWFLVGPLFILGLTGLFYHLGVKLAGVPLSLGPEERVDSYREFKTRDGVSPLAFFLVSLVVFAGLLGGRLAEPYTGMHVSLGFWWLHILFKSSQLLPLLVFQQDRRKGLWMLLVVVPALLLLRSKAAFLYIPLAFFLFYQEKLFKISKFLTLTMVGMISLTPLAVYLYTVDFAREMRPDVLANPEVPTWSESLERITHREYAFESFAIVYHTEDRLYLGEKTYYNLLLCLPSAIFRDKPVTFYDFPSQYLALDYHAYEMHYAQHLLTPFYQDFGVLGDCLGLMAMGLLYGLSYRGSLRATFRRRETWPLLVYLCLALNSKYLTESKLFNSLVDSLGLACGVLLVVGLSSLFRRQIKETVVTGARAAAPLGSKPGWAMGNGGKSRG
jgi:hypothetical protein